MKKSDPIRERPRILVADDERAIADTLRAILIQEGFEAASAYDGQEAIDRARAWHPDVILSDIIMPRLNGIEAAIQICRMSPRCRVILLSGNLNIFDLLDDARARGYAFRFVSKPVPPAELVAILREELAGSS